MIPFLPVWILLILALLFIIGWKILKFALKILFIFLVLILLAVLVYFLPKLIEYCPGCG